MQLQKLVAFLFAAACPLSAQQTEAVDPPRGFLARTIGVGANESRFVLYVPSRESEPRQWPLIVFLNGAGECGTDGMKQLAAGLSTAITAEVGAWPFLVLFPQKPTVTSQWEDHDAMVMAMVDLVRTEFAVDPKRIFLTGLSQGGHGTWMLGARHKELWAAIAPVCGYADATAIADDLRDMPIWCFHGEADQAVSVQQSKNIVAAIRKVGGKPELTLYPGVGHNSWDRAYRSAGLPEWFLAVAGNPLLAAHLARPAAITLAEFDLVIPTTTPGPTKQAEGPQGTATRCHFALRPDHAEWSVEKGDVPPASGKLARDAGERLLTERLHALLRDLEWAGVPWTELQRDATAPATRGAGSLDLVLDGEAGRCELHLALDADRDSVRAVFTALADALAAKR